jgi:hypothetical protein
MLARYGTQESPRTRTQCAYSRGDLAARSQRVVHASGGSQVASAIEPSPSALAVAYAVLPGQPPSAMGRLSPVTLLARLIGRSVASHHRPAALSWACFCFDQGRQCPPRLGCSMPEAPVTRVMSASERPAPRASGRALATSGRRSLDPRPQRLAQGHQGHRELVRQRRVVVYLYPAANSAA